MRGSKILSWVVLGSLALGLVLMLGLVAYRQGVATQENEQQHAEIVALQAGLDEANARLEAEGAAPVPVPSVDPGADAPVVPIAPSQEQILSAFDVWCDLHSCHGSDGSDGENGKDAPPMTQAQILAGFTEWCSTSDLCVGVDGTNGADGEDSTVPGPPGRPPTAEEVVAAVETVCGGSDLCRGPQGVHGVQGAQGIPGPPGTATPGDYACPDGEHMTGFSVTSDGAVTLSCQPTIGPPAPKPTPSP